jgi:hypothetical protein
MRLGNIDTFTARFELLDPGAMGAPGVQRAALSCAGKLPSGPAVYCIVEGALSRSPSTSARPRGCPPAQPHTWRLTGRRVTRGSPIELFPARQSMSCMSLRATCWDGTFGSRGQRHHANTVPGTTVLMLDEPSSFDGAAIILAP